MRNIYCSVCFLWVCERHIKFQGCSRLVSQQVDIEWWQPSCQLIFNFFLVQCGCTTLFLINITYLLTFEKLRTLVSVYYVKMFQLLRLLQGVVTSRCRVMTNNMSVLLFPCWLWAWEICFASVAHVLSFVTCRTIFFQRFFQSKVHKYYRFSDGFATSALKANVIIISDVVLLLDMALKSIFVSVAHVLRFMK